MKFWRSNQSISPARERRLAERKPTTITATVCGDQNNTRQCIISSLSLAGMFLQLPQADFKPGSSLQIFFYCTEDHARKRRNEWVRVEGLRDNGVAVSFSHFDNQHQSNMQLMLHEMAVQTALVTRANPGTTTSPPLDTPVNVNNSA